MPSTPSMNLFEILDNGNSFAVNLRHGQSDAWKQDNQFDINWHFFRTISYCRICRHVWKSRNHDSAATPQHLTIAVGEECSKNQGHVENQGPR